MSLQPARYSAELRQRAIRRVAEVRSKYPSEWAAISAVADELSIRNPDTLRRWIRQAESQSKENSAEKGAASSKWRSLKKSLLRSHPIVIGVVTTVLGGMVLAYFQLALGTTKTHPAVEVDAVSLSPGLVMMPKTGVGRLTPFKIDIKLLNTGTQVAAINDARLVIQKFVKVPQCASQGGFGSTGSYRSNMPINPQPGTVVKIPISQLVEPDGADRFDLLLHTPLAPGSLGTSYLYRIHVYLDYNTGANVIDAGEMLVGVPWYPDEDDGYFWTRFFAAHAKTYFNFEGKAAPGIENCLIKNSRALNSILSMRARRTAAVSAIQAQLSFCCAARLNGS
jgi:transposase